MSTSIPIPKPAATTVLLGVATVVAQSVLLREAMTSMGGSEMAWGLVMALWLAGMGLGARLGVRVGTPALARWLPVLVLILAGTGSVLFRAAPAILGATAGETLTTWHAVWFWALAILPTAVAGGVAFPILAGQLGENGAGRAYTLEAVGALAAGFVFSLALASTGTPMALLITIAAVGGLTLWSVHPALAVGLAVGCAAVSIPADRGLASATWRWSARPGELGAWAETRHQGLQISTGPPYNLYLNGRLAASYPEPYTTLPRAHLRMLLHPAPESVLALGCTEDGSMEAMIRHPVRRLVLGESDPGLRPLVGELFGADFAQALNSQVVETSLVSANPSRDLEGPFDLVILADGDPTTLAANRTRTLEFFRACRSLMSDDGVMAVELGVGDTYLGGEAGRLLSILTVTLGAVFPRVTAFPGEHILLVAGSEKAGISTSPEVLATRLARRPGAAAAMAPEMLDLLVDESRIGPLTTFIDTARASLNTTGHPTAIVPAAHLHESRSRSPFTDLIARAGPRGARFLQWVVVMVAVILLAAAMASGSRPRATAIAMAVGLTSMGWWLLLLASWQTAVGSVYAEIGALTAAFMIGVAGGGRFGTGIRKPRAALPLILVAGAALSLCLALGPPVWLARPRVILLLVLGGGLTGMAFPPLGLLAGGGSSRRGAGHAFAADELGAAGAALLIGTVAIPWVGMSATAVGLAVISLAAVPAALRE